MSDTPVTDADIDTALAGAERFIRLDDFQGAYDILHPIHESGRLSGEQLGRAAFDLGEACLGLDGLDAAMYYYEEALQSAPSEMQQQAQQRIDEIGRRDSAVDALDEGVAGEQEADAVLASADDALANANFDTAWEYYTQAYDGIQMNRKQISRASVGLAECHVHAGQGDEAEGFLQVAENNGDAATLTDRITDLRSRIQDLAAGDAAGADGVERSELDELNRAARAAAASHDWESAYRYFLQMYESGQLAGTERGRVAHNLGVCCLKTHDYDAAHQYLTESAAMSRSDVAARSTETIADLERMDDAREVADRIDPDTDIFDRD